MTTEETRAMTDETPRTEHDVPAFDPAGYEGYSDRGTTAMRAEFVARWLAGDWPGAEINEALGWFHDEVAGR